MTAPERPPGAPYWQRMVDDEGRALPGALYEGFLELTAPERPLSASLTSSTARDGESQPAITLGACGHELDPWESHVEHHPECPEPGYPGCQVAGCACPEVCAACCRECM